MYTVWGRGVLHQHRVFRRTTEHFPRFVFLVAVLEGYDTPLHRVVNPKFTSANKTQHILSFVTEIQSSIGLLKSFIVGKYPYQHSKTITNYILGENLDIVILATKYKIN